MKAKKHLGQHFLTSKAALRDIISAAQIERTDTILEIGPGKGVLTRALLETAAHVVAIETDEDMIALLEETFAAEIKEGQLAIIQGDVLDVTISDHVTTPYKLVANIPYYITGEILRRFLSDKTPPTSITILVQKEVAERIAKSRKETVLSISVKAYGTPRYVASVPSRYFSPAPKVDSAILHITFISKKFFGDMSEERFFKVVKAGFSSKRKKLINNLASFGSKEELIHTLMSLGLSENVRAEDITLEEWHSLVVELPTTNR